MNRKFKSFIALLLIFTFLPNFAFAEIANEVNKESNIVTLDDSNKKEVKEETKVDEEESKDQVDKEESKKDSDLKEEGLQISDPKEPVQLRSTRTDTANLDRKLADMKEYLNDEKTVYLHWDPKTGDYIVSGEGQIKDSGTLGTSINNLIQTVIQKVTDTFGYEDEQILSSYQTRLGYGELGKNERGEPEYGFGINLIINSGIKFPDNCLAMFSGIGGVTYKNIVFPKDLDTSNVTNMNSMFSHQKVLNPDVGNWDTSNVTDMEQMFAMTDVANPDVSKWNVSKVIKMTGMFSSTKGANPDVSNWNTASLEDTSYMFSNAEIANPDVSNWDMSKAKEIGMMFYLAKNADPDVSKWNIKPKFAQNLFWWSGAKGLDMRTWDFSDQDDYDTAGMFNDTEKLQYLYLPADYPTDFDPTTNPLAEDFKMQKDGEKASAIIPNSHSEHTFKGTGIDTVYFVPQKTTVNIKWLDEDMKDKTRPKDRKIELLANGKSIDPEGTITMPKDSNILTLDESNGWAGEYSDLDIFSNGSKIKYFVKQDPIDDYITEIKGSNKKGFTIYNSYRTIIEEKEIGKKPKTPENFVKVTVDTTDKATDESKFKRVFWVTPNREVTLPVDEPVGKTLDGKIRYNFENWQEENGQRKWNKGEKISGVFKEDTEIFAQYSEEEIGQGSSFVIRPADPIKDHLAYIEGYPDSTIRPEGNLTRAEAAALVIRLGNIRSIDRTSMFSDTEEGAWYNIYVNTAFDKGMLLAEENKIRPNQEITRAEFAKLISKVDKENSKDLPFEDTKGHKFEKEISQAYANGRIEGYPDKTFKPDGKITRAEAVKILNSLFERSADKAYVDQNQDELRKFKDLDKNHWAYYDLVEAANSHECKRAEDGKIDEIWRKIINK